MAVSQNGWTAYDRTLIERWEVPGGVLPLRKGAAGTVLVWLATQFHHRVEPLVWPGCWGYAERTIVGSTVVSNHASGTAMDLNAPAHPLGAAGTFSAAQVAELRRLLAECGGVIRWGGDYGVRKDEMHFEIIEGPAAVEAVALRLEHSMTCTDDCTRVRAILDTADGYHTSNLRQQLGFVVGEVRQGTALGNQLVTSVASLHAAVAELGQRLDELAERGTLPGATPADVADELDRRARDRLGVA